MTDKNGFLWIITENGLSRFDGHTFKNFKNNPNDSLSLPSNNLTDIAIDKHNKIWLAYGHGFCVFDPITFKASFPIFNHRKLRGEKLDYDEKGDRVYVCSETDGLYIIEAKTLRIKKTSLSKQLPRYIWHINHDAKGQIWISIDRNGFIKYDILKDTARHFLEGFDGITGIFPKNDSTLFGTCWGHDLLEFNDNNIEQSIQFHPIISKKDGYSQVNLTCIVNNKKILGDHLSLVTTLTDGMYIYNRENKSFAKVLSLPTDYLHWAYTDRNQITWICTWNHGLLMLSKEYQQFKKREFPELVTNFYNCITGISDSPTDSTLTWMSVNGSGIAMIDKQSGKFKKWFLRDLDKNGNDINYNKRWCLPLYKDNVNQLWSCSYGGFIKIKDKSVQYLEADLKNKAYYSYLFMDDDQNLWALGSYITKLNTRTEKSTYYTLEDINQQKYNITTLTSIVQGYDDKMLVGTNEGLFSLDPNSKKFTIINYWSKMKDTSSWKWVNSLVKIKNKLYIGTKLGVVEYDLLTKNINVLSGHLYNVGIIKKGLSSDSIGMLWVYSTKGLIRYNPVNQEMLIFDKNDGLYTHSSDEGYFFLYNDEMYIGHRMAYTKFNPILINNYEQQPLTRITEIKYGKYEDLVNAKSIQNLKLNHYHPNITFYYTGIEFNYPEKTQFITKLEGFDTEWSVPTSERYKEYTNLPPGTYTFKVIAYNPIKGQRNNIDSFSFIVVPAFWQTWWFKIFSLLSFILLTVLFAKRRIAKVRLQEEEKTLTNKKIAELDEKLLRSQMNPHFIFNSLNSIQKYIWENKEEDAAEYLSKFAKLMRGILENSRKDTIALKDEISLLTLYLDLEHRRTNGIFDYKIEVGDTVEASKFLVPPMIIQPFAENSIWHGLSKKNSHGTLEIYFVKEEDTLVCIIKDDGVGRSYKNESTTLDKKSLGMNITKQRLERLMEVTKQKASLEIIDLMDEHQQACGTKVIIRLPIIY